MPLAVCCALSESIRISWGREVHVSPLEGFHCKPDSITMAPRTPSIAVYNKHMEKCLCTLLNVLKNVVNTGASNTTIDPIQWNLLVLVLAHTQVRDDIGHPLDHCFQGVRVVVRESSVPTADLCIFWAETKHCSDDWLQEMAAFIRHSLWELQFRP